MKIRFIGKDRIREIECRDQMSILNAAAEAGAALYAPCGGQGRCGRCRVTASGALSLPDEVEIEKLGTDAIEKGERLACRAVCLGDCTVVLPDAWGVDRATREDFACANVGAAIDIGTTTVEASLVDLSSGRRISYASAKNPQSVCGADVISRISAAEKVGVGKMKKLVRGCAADLLKKLGAHDGIPTIVVGNTTMMSIWAGVDPAPIGRSPFEPTSLFGCEIDGAYLPRCVSGNFGADAVASVVAASSGGDDNILVVDAGTNGEVAVLRGGELFACAAAAGPALEGAGISCGMTAVDGAICSASIVGGKLVFETVGGGAAKGICGSGLFDVVACLLMLGVIDRSGRMNGAYELADGVYITPQDVRAFQLAKGAIRAAIDIAADSALTSPTPLYLSGAFGTGLSVRSCVRTGLIPRAFAEDVRFIGNGALRGAEMMLCDRAVRDNADALARNAEYMELSGSDAFAERFVRSLDF